MQRNIFIFILCVSSFAFSAFSYASKDVPAGENGTPELAVVHALQEPQTLPIDELVRLAQKDISKLPPAMRNPKYIALAIKADLTKNPFLLRLKKLYETNI